MKKVDYYAVQGPWRMPKWLGFTLGGVFGVIAIGSVFAILSLTRPPAPPVAAVAAMAAPSTPAAEPAAQPTAAATPAPAAPAAEVAAAAPASRSSRHHKHASARHSSRHAVASRSSGISSKRAKSILAKSENTRQNRKDKDALDKLLGL